MLHFWDLVDPTKTWSYQAHKRVVSCVAYHPSPLHNVLATASFDGTVKVFAAESEDIATLLIKADADA